MVNKEVEPCPVCAEGWRQVGSAHCNECYEGKIDTLIQALAMQEVAENAHLKCDECDPSDAPETCEKCFPLYDDARIARRRVLAAIRREHGGDVGKSAMTAIEELEMLARDCEEMAIDAADDKGLQRALFSINYRIWHALKKMPPQSPAHRGDHG